MSRTGGEGQEPFGRCFLAVGMGPPCKAQWLRLEGGASASSGMLVNRWHLLAARVPTPLRIFYMLNPLLRGALPIE